MSVSTQDKRVKWDWQYLQSIAETENLYLLTDRDVQALITPLAVMQWRTRVLNAPSDFDLVNTFNATLLERLLTPMDFCALMIDCIENDTDVRDALKLIIRDEGIPFNRGGENPFGTGIGEENILNGLSCGNDDIYGYCVAIVDYIEVVARDFIELLVSETDNLSRIVRAIDYIPIIGDLPLADDLNDLIDWFVINGTASFDAGYTSTMRQELICYLFDSACGTCEITPYSVYSAYAAQSGIPLNVNDVFWTLVGNMLGLSTDTAFAAGTCAMIAGALASGGEVLGLVGLQGLKTIAASGNPDSDWTLYCSGCLPDLLPITVTFDSGGYTNYTILQGTVQALGVSGNCLRDSRTCSHCSNSARIDVLFDDVQYVDQISVAVWTRFATISWSIIAYDASNNVLWSVGGNPVTTPNGWTTLSYTGLALTGVKKIYVSNGNGSGGSSQLLDNRIDNIYVA